MKRNTIIGTSIVVLLLVGVALWYWLGSDREIEKLKQLQAEVFSKETRELPDEERREKFANYRQQYERLSESQQRQLRKQMYSGQQQRISSKIHAYFELPKAQRIAYLDKQIKESEKRRKQFANRSGTEKSRTGRTGGGGPGRGGPGRGGDSKMTDAERGERRDRFKRGMLDRTTPQQRAEMAAYMEALKERREQLGLPDRGGRPRRFHNAG